MHEGHRKRKKNFVAENGFNGLPSHEVLEVLLFYCIPRVDTNEIAHCLIDRFGSLSAVLDAKASELCEVPGVGTETANYLKMLPELFERYKIDKLDVNVKLTNKKDISDYLNKLYEGCSGETLYCICLSRSKTVVAAKLMATGFVDRVEAPVESIVKFALSNKVKEVIIVHNHPFGEAKFSNEDMNYTALVKNALNAVNIELVDHFLLAEGECISFYHGII